MNPDKPAIVFDDRQFTYREIDERATRIAHGLASLGVGNGDRVAYLGLNSVDFVVTMFGTAKLGAVTVPLNTRLAAPETAWILGDCTPKVLVWAPPFDEVIASEDMQTLDLQLVRVEGSYGADGTQEGTLGALEAAGAETAATAEPIDEEIALGDLFMIQYTSGTSGRPKGVMLTHENITFNVYNTLIDMDFQTSEKSLIAAPLFHTAALNQVLFPTFIKGGTAYIEPGWDPGRTLEMIQGEGITMLFGVTSMYQSLVHHPKWDETDLSSVRTALCGGAPVPETLLHAYLDRDAMILQAYGLTESSPGATLLRGHEGTRKVGSAGTSCFFSDVKVVRADLTPVEAEEPGEILVQGFNVTPGYWQNDKATKAAFTEGQFLRTGDLAKLDDEGFIYIVDRVKDMIISGGENIYPAEVEGAIYTHPGIAECAVIGVPDDKWGEVGRAVVVPRKGVTLEADEVLEHLDGRIARYKIPKTCIVVEELPHNASGKLVKNTVRELYG